jgi:hypothetical protein
MKLQVMIKHPYNNHGLDFRKPQCLSVPNTFIVLLSHFPFGCVGVLIHVFIQRSCRRLMVLFSWSKGSGRSFYLSIYLSIDRSINRSIYLSIYMRVYLLVHTTSIMYVYIYIHTKQSAIHPYVLCVDIYVYVYYMYMVHLTFVFFLIIFSGLRFGLKGPG